jgi:membrane associated rhomboid family serine protease
MIDLQELLSFRKMITPMIIQILFWVGAGICVLMGLISLGTSFTRFGGASTFFSGLVLIVVGPVLVRVYCELIIIFFRINESLEGIKKDLEVKQQ